MGSGHYADFADGRTGGERHMRVVASLQSYPGKLTIVMPSCAWQRFHLEDNSRRLGHSILLQQMEGRVFGEEMVQSSLGKAFMFKERLGRQPWKDIVPEVSEAHAQLCR